MKRLIATALLGIGLSCAGNQAVTPTETVRETIERPTVTGAVRLSFAGIFGEEKAIRSPWGISFGIDGTLYVCDRGKSSIVRLDSTGVILLISSVRGVEYNLSRGFADMTESRSFVD